ncbi:MAG: hypothetical protein ACL93V_11450 [Candidatus Electrothrix sp. YB6]
MYNSTSQNRVFRNQYSVFFLFVSVTVLLLPLASVQAAAQGLSGDKEHIRMQEGAGLLSEEISGIVKKMPGVAWPYGIWKVGGRKIMVTEQTALKGETSKARFGEKISVTGSLIDGVFTAHELQIGAPDPMYAGD